MNKNVFLVIPLGLIGLYGTQQVTAKQGCAPMDPPPPAQCQNAPGITINNQSHTVSPPNICVQAGGTIGVNVVPNGIASVSGKDGGWPNGSDSSFTLNVPNTPGVAYEYNVTFDDGSCLDPRISVQ